MLQSGRLLQGRYRITSLLGEGGMGTVYEAVDERLHSTVALKQTTLASEHLRSQFEREARLLARLRHPALTKVIDHFSEENGQFLVMEYIEGPDLHQRMKQRGAPFAVQEVVAWTDQLLDALDYLHTQATPIVHRDIKPQNLKLTMRNQIILLDFGLAKEEAWKGEGATTASLYGYTPHYAALEQIHGSGTDARSDLYSLGATMYSFVTARKPVDALARAQAAIAGEPDPLVSPDTINGHVSAPLSRLILDAMELNREKRPATAAAMRERLRASFSVLPTRETKDDTALKTSDDGDLLPTIVSGADVDSGPRGAAPTVPASGPGTRRRRTFVPLVVGVLVVVAGAGYFFLRRDDNRPAGDAVAGTEITVPAAAATPAIPPALPSSPQTRASRLGGHTGSVYGVDWSRDARRIATTGNDSLAIIWDAATGRELKRIPLTGEGNSVAFSPDAKTLAVGITYSPSLNKSLVAFFDAESGSLRRSVYGKGGLIGNVTWSPDGRLVGFNDGPRVRTVDAEGTERVFGVNGNAASTFAFSRDGGYIAAGGLDKVIDVWNVATGASVATMETPNAVRAIAFSPDAKTIAIGTYDEFLYLADAATGNVRETIPMPAFINDLAYTSDGAMLVIALNESDSIALFDLAGRKIIRRWGGVEAAGQRLRIAPASRKVLVAMGNSGEISNF